MSALPPSKNARPVRRIPIVSRSDYIVTDSGNRISRQSHIKGSQYITLGGKNLVEKGVTIRGDLHRPDIKAPVVSVGRFCIFEVNSTVSPPSRAPPPVSATSGDTQPAITNICAETGKIHFPIKIGSYVFVGEGTRLEAAQIGNNVYIGKDCSIGEFAIIKDCVVIEDGTVVPPYVTISPFSKVSGEPSQTIEELPESAEQVLEVYCRRAYAGIDVGGPPF